MSTEDKMNIDERWKYLRMMKRRYEQARRQECKRLLGQQPPEVLHQVGCGQLAEVDAAELAEKQKQPSPHQAHDGGGCARSDLLLAPASAQA